MPIYMDRHEIPDATPEEVALAHYEDLKLEEKHGVRVFTYWLDPVRGAAFCLMDAPSEDAVHALHEEAHGLVPHRIIEVDPAQVASFLGRVADPESAATNPINESAFRALMFTDMANSTDITNQLGDAAAFAVLKKHREIIGDQLASHEGREVDRAGDGFLTCFASVTNAVGCAVAIQQDFEQHNEAHESEVPIQVRIGLGAGEPVSDGDALFGSTVNLTARICARAEPTQILSSTVIRELCVGKGFVFEPYGEVTLKGFPDPVALDAVRWQA